MMAYSKHTLGLVAVLMLVFLMGQTGPCGVIPSNDGDGFSSSQGTPSAQSVPGSGGQQGPQGPAGVSCWDINGSGVGDSDEDVNHDGVFDVRDCQGGITDHGQLAGLDEDDHPQYVKHGEPNSITTIMIMGGVVTNSRLADNAVNTQKIEDGAVTSDKITSVLPDKIIPQGSGSGLDADMVDGKHASELMGVTDHGDLIGLEDDDHPQYVAHGEPDTVTTTMIQNGAVTNDKINSLAPGKITPQGTDSGLDADLLDGNHASDFALADHTHEGGGFDCEDCDTRFVNEGQGSSITANMIQDSAVSSSQLASNCVDSSKIVNDSVTASDLALNSVTSSELANNSIDTGHIVDGTVTGTDIANNSITNADIATNAVNSSELATNSVSSGHIVNNSIQSEDLGFTVGDITAVNAGTNLSGGGSSGSVTLSLSSSITVDDLWTSCDVNAGDDVFADDDVYLGDDIRPQTAGTSKCGTSTEYFYQMWSQYFFEVSSCSFKKNIEPLSDVESGEIHDAVLQTMPSTYLYKTEYLIRPGDVLTADDESEVNLRSRLRLGCIAEDLPLVVLDESGMAIDRGAFATMLLVAIQEQAKQIEEQERRIAELERSLVHILGEH